MVAAALALLLAAVPPPPVVVDGKPITEPEVVRALRDRIKKTMFHRNVEGEQLAKLRREVIADLTQEELRAQEGRRRGLTVPGEPAAKVEAAEERNAGGPVAFDVLLASYGIDRRRYLEVVERPALAKRLVEAELAARLVAPTREDALAHYRKNKARYLVPAALRLAETCVQVDRSSDEAGWLEGKRRAEALRARLLSDFKAVARELACDGFAEQGGELGVVHQGSLDPGLEKAALALRDGEVSAPVRALRGWYLVKRVATQPARQAAFEEVEASILAELRQRRKDAVVAGLDRALRSRARVVLRGDG